MHRLLGLLALGALLLLLVPACARSHWETAYSGARRASIDPDRVLIREAPWSRVAETRAALEAEVAASDTHPDEWPQAHRDAAKAVLLRGLQVSEDPATIEVLGRSEFRTTDQIRPDDGLREFAAAIGATRVVHASRWLGKAERIVSEPVTTYTTGSDWVPDRHGHRRDAGPFSSQSTTWVPIRIEADETAWVAYFLRDLSAGRAD